MSDADWSSSAFNLAALEVARLIAVRHDSERIAEEIEKQIASVELVSASTGGGEALEAAREFMSRVPGSGQNDAITLCDTALAALRSPASPVGPHEASSAPSKCCCVPTHSQECVFRDARSASYRHFYANETFQVSPVAAASETPDAERK